MNTSLPLYVSADIVNKNSIPSSQEQQLIVTDVFDIPDIEVPNLIQRRPEPITQQNFIQSINHTAMTDVMNHLAVQKQKTPSPSAATKQSGDVSIRMMKPSNTPQQPQQQQKQQQKQQQPLLIHAATSCSSSYNNEGSQSANHLGSTTLGGGIAASKKNTKHRVASVSNKVIIEEEDKESAIDYDDDDPAIKKIKLSLFHFAKDITFNLIFAIPFLRTKLSAILREQTLAINQIERVFDEFKDQLNKFQLESIKKYVCEDGIRDKLNFILETGFNKILADGVIDINDAPQFNQLVYFIIKSFNDINYGKVYRFYVSREHVMLLLHFILKSVFTLTLKGQEEQMAIGLLDTSFKLVHLEVLPLVSKRWYHKFRIWANVKDIEDIIE
jgi:hypothetical protein